MKRKSVLCLSMAVAGTAQAEVLFERLGYAGPATSPSIAGAQPDQYAQQSNNVSLEQISGNEADAEALEGKTLKTIEIEGINESKQLDNAKVFLTLEKVKDQAITRPNYVNYLIENGKEEIARSQQPFGYYNVQVEASRHFDGQDLSVTYRVTLNQPVHINQVHVQVEGEAESDEAFAKLIADNPLKKGDQLEHLVYEQYKTRLEALAGARGYFESRFAKSTIYVDPKTNTADIELLFDSGPRYRFGAVEYSETPLDKDLLERFAEFKPGEPYISRDVAILQQDLQGSGYFKQVLVGNKPDTKTKTVPIEAQLTMNKNKHYVFGLGYSTDEGVRGKFDFDWRWVNARGHTFNSKTFVSQKKYSFDNIYRIPAENPTTDYYYIRAGASHENDKFKNTRAFLEGGYNFIDGKWSHQYAVVSAWEDFTIGNDKAKTLLTYPQANWVYSSTTNRINPKSGYQVGLGVRGAVEKVLSDISFAQTDVKLRAIYPLNERNSIIGRSNLGATWTDDFNRLPPSLRYFAGGDRSIRGYAYRQIGPRDSSGTNVGGKYLATGSLEYEYYFLPDWAAATFVDAGDAFTDDYETKIGAGVGVRWRSPVGPIAVDIAHGFDEPNDDNFRLHINVGTELDL